VLAQHVVLRQAEDEPGGVKGEGGGVGDGARGVQLNDARHQVSSACISGEIHIVVIDCYCAVTVVTACPRAARWQ
jgi:hypothetical protein